MIEQAKGVLAERLQVSIDDAFMTLRSYARLNNRKLAEVAQAVATGDLSIPLRGDSGRPDPAGPLRGVIGLRPLGYRFCRRRDTSRAAKNQCLGTCRAGGRRRHLYGDGAGSRAMVAN